MEWKDIVEVCSLVLLIIAACGGTTMIISKLKTYFNLQGSAALYLSSAVTIVVTILTAITTGIIYPELLNDPVEFITVLVTIFLGSEKLYRYKKAQQ